MSKSGSSCSGWDNSNCRGSPFCQPRCPRLYDKTGTPIMILPYTPEMRSGLVELYHSFDDDEREMGLPPYEYEEIDNWIGDLTSNGWNLVARDGDDVVGHAAVSPATAPDPQFVVFLREDHQNRGIGTELVNQTVAYAAERDHDVLKLSVNQSNRRALKVYRNVGFEPVPVEIGDHDEMFQVQMELTLDQPTLSRIRLPPARR